MIKNLIIIKNNTLFDRIFIRSIFIFKKFPNLHKTILKCYSNIKIRMKYRRCNIYLRDSDTRFIDLNKIRLYKYKIPLLEYRERYKNSLFEGKGTLDLLEKLTVNYRKEFRNLDMHMVYENNILRILLSDFLKINLSLKIFIENNYIDNLFFPKEIQEIYELFKFNNKNKNIKINLIKRGKCISFIEKVLSKYLLFSPLRFLIYYINRIFTNFNRIPKKSKINNRFNHHTKTKNVGFFYNSITHKRVGEDTFNFLKNRKYNVVEIDPYLELNYVNLKELNQLKKLSKNVLLELKNFYYIIVKKMKNPLYTIFFKYFLSKLSFRINLDLLKINHIYKTIIENQIDLLFVFNDNSFEGKVATLICKNLSIATIYIPHGSISETYILVFPKWCDIMVLNTEIEKDFLLNGKLKPSVYANRLVPLGNLYFKPLLIKAISEVQDIYSKKNFNLFDFKYKILIGLSIESTEPVLTIFSNMKIIKDIINFFRKQEIIKNFILMFKLHPSDNPSNYHEYFSTILDIPIVVIYKTDIRKLILATDLFLTTISTTILEGILHRVPTVIMDYYYDSGYLLYSNEEIISNIRDKNDLEREVTKFLLDNEFREEYIKTTYNFGLEYCIGYEDKNFKEKYQKELLKIVEKLIEN